MTMRHAPAPLLRPVWLTWMEHEIARGVLELEGSESHPRIEEYLAYCAPRGKVSAWFAKHVMRDETPWCSAAMNAAMIENGFPGTGSLAARSWLKYGRPVELKPGAICVFSRGLGGHVGVAVEWSALFVWVAGGNQSNAMCVKPYHRSRLLGCRWPTAQRLIQVKP